MRFLAALFCSVILCACGGGDPPIAAITASTPQPVRAASVLTGGNRVAVHVYQALYGQAPSNVQLSSFLAQIGSGDGFAWANSMASSFSNLSNTALSTLVLNNVSITATSLTGTATFGTPLQAYSSLQGALADYFGSVGVGNRGIVIVQLSEIISNLEVDTQFGVYGGAAIAFNKQVDANYTYSSNAANLVAAAVSLSTVNAGSAQTVVVGHQVTLDGTGSSSVSGEIVAYAWTLKTRPGGSSATLSSLNSGKPTFAPDIPGTYVATLIVNDGAANSNPASVTITALANVAPVANAGVAQSAYLGDLVTLDGSASSDANGDALTYAWTARSYPLFFAPTIVGANTARPNIKLNDAGTYVFSLVVYDGQVSSAASTAIVTVTNGVRPTPAGSGLVVESVFNFWTLDETTLTKRVDFSCGVSLYAIDRSPDGVIVGTNYAQLYEISPVTGVCSARGNTPEEIRAVAVSALGQVFGMSLSQVPRTDGTGGVAHRLHKLTSNGASQSYVFLSGASSYVNAMAFGPDGQLYGLGINSSGGGWSIVRINTETGVTTVAFAMPVQPTLGDIDIDSLGVLRTMIDGKLYKFNISTGTLISSTSVPNFPLGNSFAPIVYVP